MASTLSLKELSKAIKDFVVEPTVPLPDDLVETIAAYLRRHEKYDEAASDRLQEDLLLIFEKSVRGNPAASGAWLSILRRLLPVLRTPERILVWSANCRGILDKTGFDKNIVAEAVAILNEVVAISDEYHDDAGKESASNPLIDRLFEAWMDEFHAARFEGFQPSEHSERMIGDALGQFGKKRPKACTAFALTVFFSSLDGYVVKKKYRKASLIFFCDFIQSQPPHLHQVTQTPLFTDLLTCLQQDTSTTVISAALTALIMLLPHMPSSLVPHLPTLFNIYTRLLFWEKERAGTLESPSHDSELASRWEVSAYDPETEDTNIPHLSNYYTILYGLYPINFMDYIRKPQRYVRHANAYHTDEIEVQPTEIRHQSERFRSCHVLHPNFYTLTIETEKTDFGRWIKSEAAEVVAECMALCVAPETPMFADHELLHLPESSSAQALNDELSQARSDPGLLSSSVTKVNSWRNTHLSSTESVASDRTPSTLMRRGSQSSHHSARDGSGEAARPRDGSGADGPSGTQLLQSASHTQLQDLIRSNKAIKSSLHQSLANDSVPSLALSHQESVVDRPSTTTTTTTTTTLPPPQTHTPVSTGDGSSAAQIAHLQRQLLLLQNDLSFERYLKQQHMAHIGELRRRQMAEAATEAEMQNLIMMNRNLKSRFEEAKMAEMQVRKESEKRGAMAKKWEADLANKLKNLREESKKMQTEVETVRKELEESQRECEKLRKLVCDAEVKELNARQNMQSIEMHGAEIDRLKAEVERLSLSERDWQAREFERMASVNAAEDAQNQLETLKLQLAAAQTEVQRTKRLFQSQVAALQAQLSDAREERNRPAVAVGVAVESALAASRAKQAEMQKQYSLLTRKYTVLQSSLLDMQLEATLATEKSSIAEGEEDRMSSSTGPGSMKSRQLQLLSTAEAAEGATYNAASSPGSHPGTPTSSMLQPLQPTSSTGTGGTDGQGSSVNLSMSPERSYFGSGLPSMIRKDSRDKTKDESSKPKKEKKSIGFRGIRGFVNN
ncbi:tuberous sclerosis 1 [Trichoderma cornu-damae]|uniref:Tuberous sclerosis 1 n=1 Tax=Trichoderma cornu-damae TaxID=654480 RepID=A0A9P8TXX8_9HYPO|nr:tuberous sclerosis 1 [Trichoderma cornu-damae]